MVPCCSTSSDGKTKSLALVNSLVLSATDLGFSANFEIPSANQIGNQLEGEEIISLQNPESSVGATDSLDLDADVMSSLIYKTAERKPGDFDGLPDFVKGWTLPTSGGMDAILNGFATLPKSDELAKVGESGQKEISNDRPAAQDLVEQCSENAPVASQNESEELTLIAQATQLQVASGNI